MGKEDHTSGEDLMVLIEELAKFLAENPNHIPTILVSEPVRGSQIRIIGFPGKAAADSFANCIMIINAHAEEVRLKEEGGEQWSDLGDISLN